MQAAERNFCKDLDVARTRQYGGTASRVMFIYPLKTYTELHLNFRFLPNSKHIPSGLWKPLSKSWAENFFFQSHAEHVSAFSRHKVDIGHVKKSAETVMSLSNNACNEIRKISFNLLRVIA